MLLGPNKEGFPCFFEEHRTHSNKATSGFAAIQFVYEIPGWQEKERREAAARMLNTLLSENKHREDNTNGEKSLASQYFFFKV